MVGARDRLEPHPRLSPLRFEFPVERAVFLTVLHRLFELGSDRQADRWRGYQRIEGIEALMGAARGKGTSSEG